MDKDDLKSLTDNLEDGQVRKTIRFLSRSPHWMPWVTHPVLERIEVGLFREFSEHPDASSFALEWLEGNDGEAIQIRSLIESWQTLHLLPELVEVVERAAERSPNQPPGAEEVWSELSNLGYVEDDFGVTEEVESLPLPPEEPRAHPLWLTEEAEWLGPHVGRSFRFLALVKSFLAALDEEDVVALDFRAGYRDSAFHRLWECMDHDTVEERHIKASGRNTADEVPYVCTDTLAYLVASVEDGEKSANLCGVDLGTLRSPSGKNLLTFREPISSLIVQVWDADDNDQARIREVVERVSARIGLVADWDSYPHRIALPDNDDYRLHGVDP